MPMYLMSGSAIENDERRNLAKQKLFRLDFALFRSKVVMCVEIGDRERLGVYKNIYVRNEPLLERRLCRQRNDKLQFCHISN